jgi:hypothetical protein
LAHSEEDGEARVLSHHFALTARNHWLDAERKGGSPTGHSDVEKRTRPFHIAVWCRLRTTVRGGQPPQRAPAEYAVPPARHYALVAAVAGGVGWHRITTLPRR